MRVRGTNAFSNNLPTSNGTEVLITPDVYEVNGAERMPVDATPNPNDTTVLDQSTSNKYITDVVTAPELEPFPTAPPAPAPEPPPKVDPATDPDCAGLTAEQCYKLQEQKKKHGAVVWHKENPDGSHTFRFQDGHEWTIFPDGTVFEKFANGVERWTYPDGTTDTYNPGTGERVIKYPDGTTQRKPYPINTPAEEVWNGTAPAPGESTWTAPDGSPMPNPNPAPSPSPSPNPSPQPYPTPPPAQPPTSTPPPTNTQPGCVCDQVTFVGPGIAFEEKFPFSLILYVYEGWKSFAASGTNAPSFSLLPGTKPVSVAGLDGFIKPLRSVMLVVSLMGLCWVMWEAIKKDK